MNIKEHSPATQQTSVKPAQHKKGAGMYLGLSIISLIVYLLFRFSVLSLPAAYQKPLMNILIAMCAGSVVFLIRKIIEIIILKKLHQKALRYNLTRILRLISVLIVILIFVSFLFQNWYTAIVLVGLVSLILGFALQTPSFLSLAGSMLLPGRRTA